MCRRKVTGALKAVHDKYAKALGEREEYQAEFQEAILYNDQIGGLLNKVPNTDSCKQDLLLAGDSSSQGPGMTAMC